jgi:hypothetical protein
MFAPALMKNGKHPNTERKPALSVVVGICCTATSSLIVHLARYRPTSRTAVEKDRRALTSASQTRRDDDRVASIAGVRFRGNAVQTQDLGRRGGFIAYAMASAFREPTISSALPRTRIEPMVGDSQDDDLVSCEPVRDRVGKAAEHIPTGTSPNRPAARR